MPPLLLHQRPAADLPRCPAALFWSGGSGTLCHLGTGRWGAHCSPLGSLLIHCLPACLPAFPPFLLSLASLLPSFLPSRQVIDSPEVLSVIDALPHIRPFLSCLYECKYAEFFRVGVPVSWSPV